MKTRTTVGTLTLVGVLVSLAFSGPAWAQKGGGGGGGGKPPRVTYSIAVVNPENTLYTAPTYLPTCTAGSAGYTALFDRHDLCATVTTSTGYQLTDDIIIGVNTTKGLITSVQLKGQDVIGEEGIKHESEVWPITPPFTPPTGSFTLHVHADNLPIWKLDGHLGGERVEIVGYISIGDMVYTPK